MAWRKLEDTFHSDRKIRKLARELTIPEPHAAGYVVTLWTWALLHAKDGDLSKFDIDDIEYGAKWDGEHGMFFNACVTTRFIDAEPSGGMFLHNWITRGGSFADAQRKRLEYQKKGKSLQDSPGVSRRKSESPGKSALEESRVEENRREYTRAPAAGEPAGQTDLILVDAPKSDRDDIQEVWRHYRTHHPRVPEVLASKRREYRLIRERLKDYSADDLRVAIDGYHRSPWHTGQNPDSKKYLSLELMMRSVSHVQQGLEMADSGNSNRGRPLRLLDEPSASGNIPI